MPEPRNRTAYHRAYYLSHKDIDGEIHCDTCNQKLRKYTMKRHMATPKHIKNQAILDKTNANTQEEIIVPEIEPEVIEVVEETPVKAVKPVKKVRIKKADQ